MEFKEADIWEYKEKAINDFMLKPIEEIKAEFNTDRICWAFVMWTYRQLNIFIDSEDSLKLLVKNFKRVQGEYQFPDIIIFKHSNMLLGRHAGIMLDKKRFVHLERDCNGLQFTDLTRLPWSHFDRVVIRHDEIHNT